MRDLDDDHALEELRNRIADIGAEDDGKLARLRVSEGARREGADIQRSGDHR